MFRVTIIDEFEERHVIYYYEHQYPSLMELIRHDLGSEIGDCRGRIWCNTCAVQSKNKVVEIEVKEELEKKLLCILNIENIRLSCQLFLTKELHNTEWKILDSRRLF